MTFNKMLRNHVSYVLDTPPAGRRAFFALRDVTFAWLSSPALTRNKNLRVENLPGSTSRAGSVILTYKIRKFPSPKKIWFSKEERDHFSTSAFSCIDYLLTFRAIFNEEP